MSKDKLDEIEKKKRELQAELDRIQAELDHSFDEVRSDVSNRLQPAEFIKRYPLPVVGLSVLVGFLAGHKRRDARSSSESDSKEDGFSSVLLSELKKLATRKAVSFATDYIEGLLSDTERELSPTTNGSVPKDEQA